jgi:hypothetical protein
VKKRPYDSSRRREAYALYERIFDILCGGEYEIILIKMLKEPAICERYDVSPALVGMIDPAEKTIYVDFRQDVVATIVHECLHALFPEKEEKQVHDLEELVMDYLTSKQATRLFIAASNNLVL